MRFAMVFEGIDRATKVMSKIMSAEKKTAKAMEAGAKAGAAASNNAARATQKHASALSRIGGVARTAYSAVVAGANAAARATVALHKKTVALGKIGFGQVKSGAGKVFRGLTVAAGAATAAFGTAALAAGGLLETATSFESYRIQLETLEGSSAKGKAALGWITTFAAKTPLELDQVVESYRNLKTFGLDPTDGTLMALVDTMAASGKGVEQLEGLTLALGQAWTKEKLQGEEALQLLERGVPVWEILSQKYGKTASQLQEMASKGKLGREAIRYLIEEIGRRNAGASEKMSQTWDGMISNLMDTWLRFKLAIMDAGLFDWMKGKLQLLLDTVNRMAVDGTLAQWATYVSDRIIFVLDTAWTFGKRVWEILKTLGGYLQMAADYVGGWENLAMVLAGIAFAPTLISTAAGLVQIVVGLSMLGAALMANPIMLGIAAIVAGAAAIYLNWEPIKAFFVDLWGTITAGAQKVVDAIARFTGIDPMKAMSAFVELHATAGKLALDALSEIGTKLSAVWDNLPSLEWGDMLTALNWASYIFPIRWLEFIPGFEWGDLIADFSWPELPKFEWPELPALSLPELPNIRAYLSGFADDAMEAISEVSAKLGTAWAKVKSAFTWGEESISIETADPATIQATAAAVAGLKTDLQAVAAIDTSAASARISALDAAAGRIASSITASIRQAEATLAAVNFYPQGVAMMDTLAAGIRARAAVVVEEVRKVTQMVRDHLPSSPAKTGPLSDIHRLKFGETIASSIRSEPMVKAMRAAALATMGAASLASPSMAEQGLPVTGADAARAEVARVTTQSAGSAQAGQQGGGASIVYSPTIHLSGELASAQQSFAEQLRQHSRDIARLLDEEKRRDGRTST
ncbi:tape measure protein [Shinella sp.]|uniref:tape measure protein n=1 Tax=Shinella sp. TaxID=1870904 RepID=UPI003F71EA69